jgi:hypothetical protein
MLLFLLLSKEDKKPLPLLRVLVCMDDNLIDEYLIAFGPPNDQHSSQGSPNRWKPDRFGRFPVLPVRPGSKNGREPVPDRT